MSLVSSSSSSFFMAFALCDNEKFSTQKRSKFEQSFIVDNRHSNSFFRTRERKRKVETNEQKSNRRRDKSTEKIVSKHTRERK